MNPNTEIMLKKYIVFVFGLFVMSIGIALSVRADMGITPISALPYVLSLGLFLTIGMLTILLHTLFLTCEILILRREFYPLSLLQLPITFLFGFFIDFSCYITAWIIPESYLMQWIVLIVSCILLGIGICLEIAAHVFVMASEGLMIVLLQKYRIDLGKSKICMDVILVVAAVSFSFLMFSTLIGVREGTVVASVVIGYCVRKFKPAIFRAVDRYVDGGV